MTNALSNNSPLLPLDRERCRRARLSRDPRFDGEFFIAVKTTGIYCRPICPARPPAEKNVLYFHSAALAAGAGFRPCLRCRPESAPNSPAWCGTSTTVRRALQLIGEGALNEQALPQLAQRLGIGERYLRKLFQSELGVSPSALALNQRLLFAKKLLAETALPMTEVAYAAGFGSVRRFNSAVQSHFKLSPGALRKHCDSGKHNAPVQLQLHYRPPYDWEGITAFYARHAVEGVEVASDSEYRRNVSLAGSSGEIRVRPLPQKNALQLQIDIDKQQLLMPIAARVRRMFDLDANPAAIAATLEQDRQLQPLVRRFPGLRSPGHWSLWETAVRGVVGQQVSTAAARGVLGRLAAAACGGEKTLFPDPLSLAALEDSHFPMPGKRRATLRALSALFSAGDGEPDIDQISALAGIGPWTTAMVAIRGGGQPDEFPPRDLGLIRAWERLAAATDLQDHTAGWSPWRSYAANLLWRSLS